MFHREEGERGKSESYRILIVSCVFAPPVFAGGEWMVIKAGCSFTGQASWSADLVVRRYAALSAPSLRHGRTAAVD